MTTETETETMQPPIPAGIFATALRAYHGDPAIKAEYLARVEAHATADEITQGQYWERGKGCAVGCTIHGSDHARYETELGIPQIVARLEDRIFEGLAPAEAKAFPLAFLAAIPVGADLGAVWPQMAVWLLTDPASGALRHARTDRRRAAIQRVVDLYTQGVTDREQYHAAADAYAAAAYAADAAYAAAAYAADAAYAAAAAYAADAAYAAAAAAYAAAAAAYAADAYAADAGRAWYIAARDRLLALLASAPVPSAEVVS